MFKNQSNVKLQIWFFPKTQAQSLKTNKKNRKFKTCALEIKILVILIFDCLYAHFVWSVLKVFGKTNYAKGFVWGTEYMLQSFIQSNKQ